MAEANNVLGKRLKTQITRLDGLIEEVQKKEQLPNQDEHDISADVVALDDIQSEFFKAHEALVDWLPETEDISIHMETLKLTERKLNRTRARLTKLHGTIPKHADEQTKEKKNDENCDQFTKLIQVMIKNGTDAEVRNKDLIKQITQPRGPEMPKLPTLTLPKFNGDYKEFVYFRDNFKSLVNARSYTDEMKFQYLQSVLSNEPLDMTRELEKQQGGYETAWKILENRYNRKRVTVDAHIQAIMAISKVPERSVSAMRNLIGELTKQTRMLASHGVAVVEWDSILVFIVKQKLSEKTCEKWNELLSKDEMPTFLKMLEFLENRCLHWEERKDTPPMTKDSKANFVKSEKPNYSKQAFSAVVEGSPSPIKSSLPKTKATCDFCKGSHWNFRCPAFLALSIPARRTRTNSEKLCFACLRRGHLVKDCKFGNCQLCGKRHNTLLHLSEEGAKVLTSLNDDSNSYEEDEQNKTIVLNSLIESSPNQILLATALVDVETSAKKVVSCRVLLDSASQSHFVTESFASLCKAVSKQTPLSIVGISGISASAGRLVSLHVRSKHESFSERMDFYVLPKITGKLPSNKITTTSMKIPKQCHLADPGFNIPSGIDMLIGAEWFFRILMPRQLSLGKQMPILQQTKLGWLVVGNWAENSEIQNQNVNAYNNISLNELIQKFWQIEEYPERHNSVLSIEGKLCEEFFRKTIRRNEQGRFIVKLPFAQSTQLLGDSRNGALACFLRLEKQLQANNDLRVQYVAFMKEYVDLGHMRETPIEDRKQLSYYMPHHAVLRPESTSTKLRTVFNASFKSNSGMSLNDLLLVGPVVQDDLVAILCRFRLHRYVFSADIKKMYRQILVDDGDVNFQRILWRDNPNDELKSYQLLTVTYGTAPASYLASRCLNQLALEEGKEFPLAAEAISDFYMDDCMTGSDDIEYARNKQLQLTGMLRRAGLDLHKWVANDAKLLVDIDHKNIQQADREIDFEMSVKALGLCWKPNKDCFYYKVEPLNESSCTKRTILAEISKLFDPIGMLAPVIVEAKSIMRSLWLAKVDWDQSPNEELLNRWFNYRTALSDLNDLRIDRWVGFSPKAQIEYHGFCDASERAYGACVYICVRDEDKIVRSNLICAKSRIAPLKLQTIPRLELCGAVLLAELMAKLIVVMRIPNANVKFWSDSTIVLTWIRSDPVKLAPFVKNRVMKLQESSNHCNWAHIASAENPADILSRGASPQQLIECKSWWNGPDWLKNIDSNIDPPIVDDQSEECQSEFNKSTFVALSQTYEPISILDKISNADKAMRIIAYLRRFIYNVQNTNDKRTGHLTISEMNDSLVTCAKIIQFDKFRDELEDLKNKKPVKKSSKLTNLNPVLDSGVIRVGGRLVNSSLTRDQRMPIVLPNNHVFVKSYIRMLHDIHLHCGPQLLLSIVRNKIWPLKGYRVVSDVVKKCLTCFRARPIAFEQLMSPLPDNRVQPNRAFLNVGVDFAGPIILKTSELRNAKKVKAYIAVFVCFSTKALHLELVSDLTSDAFVAAIKRFVARRGLCLNIYSDNGTNFVGAQNEIQELFRWIAFDPNQKEINQKLKAKQIVWHFNPAYAPHRGGLWEAAVKSVKMHLKRVLKDSVLTFERYATVLAEIEAILNSRPLSPMSSDPNDLRAITPGHFLIGEELVAMPQQNVEKIPDNRLNKWESLEKIRQNFWRRWHMEYLPSLQKRCRWSQEKCTVKLNDLVLIEDKEVHPMCWPLGRVVKIYTNRDQLPRTVDVQTVTGVKQRAIQQVFPLPS